MDIPLLSVCLITYNHVNFIKQAIDGVFMQKVDFAWELIIADDFSIDGTREIVLEYKNKYPDLIKLILQEKNVGAAQNFIDLITAPKSKYIAYFEGDDYWTDPLKLQKQVDFLESHEEFILCFHNALVKHEDCSKDYLLSSVHNSNISIHNKNTFNCTDIISSPWFIPTASIVFRNIGLKLPIWYQQALSGDIALQLLLSDKGEFKYLDSVMSVYRKHEVSLTSWYTANYLTKVIPNHVLLYNNFDDYTNFIYHQSIIDTIKFKIYLLTTPSASLSYFNYIPKNPGKYVSELTDIISNIASKCVFKIKDLITDKVFLRKLIIHGLYLHGNSFYSEGNYTDALSYYFHILKINPLEARAVTYCLLLNLGFPGRKIRDFLHKVSYS
jgi:glycosyltransferase involved in cell wall biosynthesis